MANQEQLTILRQGVEAWNRWLQKQASIHPDLREANLTGANLTDAILRGADLVGADLIGADLSRADLTGANLEGAFLNGANLTEANLTEANLNTANFSFANLTEANLTETILSGAVLNEAVLNRTVFNRAHLLATILADIDLREARGLASVQHIGPSQISISTIYRSHGQIPDAFLREAGVPDSFIGYMHALVMQPLDYYSCFISYSSKDQDFAERLYADLQTKRVRCWFAPEDMNIGEKIRPRIEESIRLYDKLLLVLSEHSIASKWVAYEVERALNKEPEGVPNVLYPIRLDEAVMNLKAGWAEDIRRTRHIGNFTHWKNHDEYQQAFARLLRALKAG